MPPKGGKQNRLPYANVVGSKDTKVLPPKIIPNIKARESQENNSFIACEVLDRNAVPQLDYDKRYLDALASIFYIGEGCCSSVILKSHEHSIISLYLTYNADLLSPRIKSILDGIQKTINSSVSKLDDKDLNIDTVCNLLVYEYLVFNTNFSSSAKTLNASLLYESSEKIDNLRKKISEARGKFKVLNESLRTNYATTMFDVLLYYYQLQIKKFDEMSYIKEQYTKKGQSIEFYKQIEKEIFSLYNSSKVIIKDYRLLLSEPMSMSKELYECFVRPLQDVTKLLSFMQQRDITNINYELISNISDTGLNGIEELHTEVNIAFHYSKTGDILPEDKPYIGLSKLSCYVCHKVLDILGYSHRGTHGLCFGGWNMQLKLKASNINDINGEERLTQDQMIKIIKITGEIEEQYKGIQKEDLSQYMRNGDFNDTTRLRQDRRLSTDENFEIESLRTYKSNLPPKAKVQNIGEHKEPEEKAISALPKLDVESKKSPVTKGDNKPPIFSAGSLNNSFDVLAEDQSDDNFQEGEAGSDNVKTLGARSFIDNDLD